VLFDAHGEFKATQLYRSLGVDATTTVRSGDALFETPREVLRALDRLEARGLVVRARAGKQQRRATRERRYVLPSAGRGEAG
jgi:hypothetical protein